MTAAELKELVMAEIAGQRERGNAHGVDLRACLIEPPCRRTYLDSWNPNAPISLWLVLEEDPSGHSGYEIVFDDAQRKFGLATPGEQWPVFLGFYGSFLEALEGM